MSSLASPARFERAAFRLGGERSILLSYGDRYLVVLHAALRVLNGLPLNVRQEELYRSAGGIVNQTRDEFDAACGDLLSLRPIGAAMRRMVKLR